MASATRIQPEDSNKDSRGKIMKSSLIRMFNCEVPGRKVDYDRLAEKAFQAGYIIEPEAATADVLDFIDEQTFNPNSTFYKQWDDILNQSQEELVINALKHYLTTYGSADPDQLEKATLLAGNGTVKIDYNVIENGFTCNEHPIIIPFKQFKIIKAVSIEYVKDKILNMMNSGIAMKEETLEDFVEFLDDNRFLATIDVDHIKNKEAQAIICCESGRFPSDEFGILRAIVYSITHSAMLIKSSEVISTLKHLSVFGKSREINLELLDEDQLKKLAKIFYRYKPIFLALKQRRKRNKPIINKIRRYAKTEHTPLSKGFWESVVSYNDHDPAELLMEVARKVDDISNFKKVQLLQAIRGKLVGMGLAKSYNIRNGKVFYKEKVKGRVDFDYLNNLYNIIRSALIRSLSKKATTFAIPDALHVVCPSSEKNFIGNYPIGTYVDFMDSDNVIGIYWRNEWGAQDFDLHVITDSGHQIGWNSMYRDETQTIVYSGDMTNADPEATELVYFKNGVEDGLININMFNGTSNAKYRLFVAKENVIPKLKKRRGDEYHPKKPCMCDPNNIVVEAMMTFNGTGQNSVGYIHDNKLYLMSLKNGINRITSMNRHENEVVQQATKVQVDSYIDLVSILEEAGFKRVQFKKIDFQETVVQRKEVDVTGLSKEAAIKKVEEAYNVEVQSAEDVLCKPELDFSIMEKDTLISLFA